MKTKEIEEFCKAAQKKKADEKKKQMALAQVIAETIPPFNGGITSQQKREAIRNNVGKYIDLMPPLSIQIDQYKIYSIVCSILASEQGLNK